MSITEILSNKDTASQEKLEQLTSIIANARKAYGNEGIPITSPKVNTTEGAKDIKYLTWDDKLALAERVIDYCVTTAIANTDCTEGAVFDSELQSLLAVNPILTNLLTKVDSKYL